MFPVAVSFFLLWYDYRFLFIGYYRFPHGTVDFSRKLFAGFDGDVPWYFKVNFPPAGKMQCQGNRAGTVVAVKLDRIDRHILALQAYQLHWL